MPPELAEAEVMDRMAQRYFCLPSAVREADTYNFRVARLLIEAGLMGSATSSFEHIDMDDDPLSDLPIEVVDG